MKRFFSIALLITGILTIGVFPIVYLLINNESLSTETIRQIAWNSDTFALSLQTARSALITALITTAIGWGAHQILSYSKQRYLWLIAYILCFIISPYIVAQGWIQILGNNGAIWQLLKIKPIPELIYSRQGLLFLSCLQFSPLALFIITVTSTPSSQETEDLKLLTKAPFFKRLYFFHFRPQRASFVFSAILIFWLVFWNYETPSILRLNTYALTVYAAFGSFYDYNQALGYLLHTVIYAIPTLGILLWVSPSLSINIRSLAEKKHLPHSTFYKLFAYLTLGIIPLLGILIPLSSLISDLGGINALPSLYDTAKSYSNDIKNSILVASSTSAITLLACLFSVYAGAKLKARNALSLSAITLLIIPPLCTGIGMVHWFSENSQGETGLERIIFTNSLVLFPLLIIPVLLAFPPNSAAETSTKKLYNIGNIQRLKLFLKPTYLPRCITLFAFGFLIVMKEVPASLLNYPPNGATVALTIETMLHFDQPQLISSLCLIQLALSLSVFIITTLLYQLCKR